MERAVAAVAVLLASSIAAAAPCTADSDCPATLPFCNTGSGICEPCDTNGGDSLCAGRFGNAPGNLRFCETDNTQSTLGQCVACLSADNGACPLDAPVCSADSCVQCTTATASICA